MQVKLRQKPKALSLKLRQKPKALSLKLRQKPKALSLPQEKHQQRKRMSQTERHLYLGPDTRKLRGGRSFLIYKRGVGAFQDLMSAFFRTCYAAFEVRSCLALDGYDEFLYGCFFL